MGVERKAQKLLSLASSEKTSEKRLNKILDQHWSCFDGDPCDICNIIDEDLNSLIDTMAENISISPAIQDRLYEAALLWQGRGYGLLLNLAGNPSISESFKPTCLDCDIWVAMNEGLDEMSDVLADVVAALSSNEAFSAAEVKAFKKEFKQSYL